MVTGGWKELESLLQAYPSWQKDVLNRGPLCPSLLLSDYLGSNLQGPGISSGDSCEKEKAEVWCQGGVRVSQGESSLSSDLSDHLAGESGAQTEINKMTKARSDEWHQTLSRTA